MKGDKATAYTKPLDEVTKDDFPLVGGKGANLGEMIRAGLPVPGGFIILTTAYRDFVWANNLKSEMEKLIRDIPTCEMDTLGIASSKIGSLFAEAMMPEDIAAEISAGYQELGSPAVSVRSSATAEDLPGTSFAGQYDTFLNIRGIDDVLEKVRLCWASLWNARAISYRVENKIHHDEGKLALAVVVQKLVDADKSGVIFTANPLNNRRDQVLINSSWGLGEPIVSGQVSPDQLMVDKRTGAVTDSKIAKKTVMTVRTETGSEEKEVPQDLQDKPTLSEKDISTLRELALRVDDHFGSPQDIEWACRGEKFYLVQTRPITSLFPIPEPLDGPKDGLRIYLSVNRIYQGITDPITPMGLELWRILYVSLSKIVSGKVRTFYPRWNKTAAGRSYLDMTSAVRNPKLLLGYEVQFALRDPIAVPALIRFLERNREEFDMGKTHFKFSLSLVGYIPFIFRFIPSLLPESFYAALFPRRAQMKVIEKADKIVCELEKKISMLKSTEERLRFVENVMPDLVKLTFYQCFYIYPGILSAPIIEEKTKEWFGSRDMFEPVMRSLPNNPTTDMGESLIRIALRLKERGETPSTDTPEIKEFLEEYGHRGVLEIDVGVERWSEDPSYILEIIQSYIEQGPEAKIRKIQENAQKAEEVVKEITEKVQKQKGPLRAWLIKTMLYWIRQLAGLRERPKFDLARAVAVLRRMFQDIGRDLVAEGRLDEVNDVFFVTFKDIESGRDLRQVVRENKQKYESYWRIKSIPRFIANTGECVYGVEAEETDIGTLSGLSISPGIYEGEARIIHEPKGSRIDTGEVLVVHSTDPSWTPLFLSAGALVMETGGLLSHGGIVAREYGIPAVAGIEGVTSKLKTGQHIRVNGNSGQVVVLNRHDPQVA